MEPLVIFLVVPVVLFFYHYLFKPWLLRNYPMGRLPADLMAMAVSITLILMAFISAVASGMVPVAGFYIILPVLGIFFVYYGIKHRNEVTYEMRRTYFAELVGYSYLFFASSIVMFWALPFMPNIVL